MWLLRRFVVSWASLLNAEAIAIAKRASSFTIIDPGSPSCSLRRDDKRAAAPDLPSGRRHGYRTKIVGLADVNAVMTQNRISGRNMEMEVRQ